MANSVLPQPAAPHSSVGRPRGNPPDVTSSRPVMPVGDLTSAAARADARGSVLVTIRFSMDFGSGGGAFPARRWLRF